MESLQQFKPIESYPKVDYRFTPEDLARYDNYIKHAVEQSIKMGLAAREWASKNFIQFHSGR